MTVRQRHRQIAAELGLNGAWLGVGREGLCDRSIRMSPGYYFLIWRVATTITTIDTEREVPINVDRAVIWEEGPQGPDSRVPPMCWWLYAYNEPEVMGNVEVAFRAGKEFAHREAFLRAAWFEQSGSGAFGLMELVPAPVPWRTE